MLMFYLIKFNACALKLKQENTGWMESGKKRKKIFKEMSTAPGVPRKLPIQVCIRSSTDQWLSAVKQLVCSTNQLLNNVN